MSQELQQEVDLTFLLPYYSVSREHSGQTMVEYHVPMEGAGAVRLEINNIEAVRQYFTEMEYDPIYFDRAGASYNRLRLWLKDGINYKGLPNLFSFNIQGFEIDPSLLIIDDLCE
jgi:hypothetical protein